MIHPSRLPKIRDQIAADLKLEVSGDDDDDVPSHIKQSVAQHLSGRLFWASEDMSALALSAGQELDMIRFAIEDRISPTGLLVMAGGIGRYTSNDGVDAPVDAVSWGPGPSDEGPSSILITTWTMRDRMTRALAEHGGSTQRLIDAPTLVAGLYQGMRVTPEEVSAHNLPRQTATILRALYAAWQLMAQPTIADQEPTTIDRKVARSYARAGRPRPEVTLVSLRHIYRPVQQDETEDAHHHYRHRWVVSGHWRQQSYGPEHSLRKRIWIPAYVKGPDGAPLLARAKVNVWRR